MKETLMSAKEYADKKGISVQAVYARIKRGELAHKKVGKIYFVMNDDDVVNMYDFIQMDKRMLPTDFGNEVVPVNLDAKMTPIQLSIALENEDRLLSFILDNIASEIEFDVYEAIKRPNIKRGAKKFIKSLCLNNLHCNSLYDREEAVKLLIFHLKNYLKVNKDGIVSMLINNASMANSEFRKHSYDLTK